MNKIKKIIFEDETSLEYRELSLEELNNNRYRFYNQFRLFEETILDFHILLDIEEYAKEKFGLIDEDEQLEIEDFSDFEILQQVKIRHLSAGENDIQNPNITNQSFVSRLTEIINRGNDAEIDNALTMLEKNYRIK